MASSPIVIRGRSSGEADGNGGQVDDNFVNPASFKRVEAEARVLSTELRVAQEREIGLQRELEDLRLELEQERRKAARKSFVDRSCQTILMPTGVQTPDSQVYRFPRLRNGGGMAAAASGGPEDPGSTTASPHGASFTDSLATPPGAVMPTTTTTSTQQQQGGAAAAVPGIRLLSPRDGGQRPTSAPPGLMSARRSAGGGGGGGSTTRFDVARAKLQQRMVGAGYESAVDASVNLNASGLQPEATPRYALPLNSFRGVRSTPSGDLVVMRTPRDAAMASSSSVGGGGGGGGEGSNSNPVSARRTAAGAHGQQRGWRRSAADMEPTPRPGYGGSYAGYHGADGGEMPDSARGINAREQMRADLIQSLCRTPEELADQCGVCYMIAKVDEILADELLAPNLQRTWAGGPNGCTMAEWLVDAMVHFSDQNENWFTRDEDIVLRATIAAVCTKGTSGTEALWRDPAASSPPVDDDGMPVEGGLESLCERVETVDLLLPTVPESCVGFSIVEDEAVDQQQRSASTDGRAHGASAPMDGGMSPAGRLPTAAQHALANSPAPPSSSSVPPTGGSSTIPPLNILAGGGSSGAAAATGVTTSRTAALAGLTSRSTMVPQTPHFTTGGMPGSGTTARRVLCDVYQTPEAVLVFVQRKPSGVSASSSPTRAPSARLVRDTDEDLQGGGPRRVLAVLSPRCCSIHCSRQAGGGRITLQGPLEEGPRPGVVWPLDEDSGRPMPVSSLAFTAPTRTIASLRRHLTTLCQCCPHYATGIFRDGWQHLARLLADHVAFRMSVAPTPPLSPRELMDDDGGDDGGGCGSVDVDASP